MGKIMTVCGEISKEELGYTSLHEHTFLDMSVAGAFMKNIFQGIPQSLLEFKLENFPFLKQGTYLCCDELAVVDDMDFLKKEYLFFKELGGQAVCDCSPIGVRGDVEKMRNLSKETGMHIICATGIYTAISRPKELLGKDEEYLYRTMRAELEHGIDGTEIRPGILKAALATCTPNGIEESEIAGIRAGARLSAETGLSLHIHTDSMVPDEELVKAVKLTLELGAKPEKVHVCHMDNRIAASVPVNEYLTKPEVDRTLKLEAHKELLAMGITIGLDTWGMPITNPQFFMPDDFERLKALITLLDMGYENQITLGNDFSSKMLGRTYGNYGCTRFADFGMSMLKQLGREKQAHKLVYENPAAILAY